ncbi:MAG TPA: sigma-70 family RNA polymerase sigma factor [Pirellulales bacterium]|nr:sigma-70 family RNA polymerase sigma factor [Pirellulales bacterium]
MNSGPETRRSLIVRLRSARDEAAWSEFLLLYEPLILRMMRKKGLQDSDARDVCQQVLAAVAGDVGKWKSDGQTASFRRWLFSIARNRVVKFLVKSRKGAVATGGTDAQRLLEAQPDSQASISAEFEREYRHQLLVWAADQVRAEFRDSTWRAFWQTCIVGRSAADVAAELETSLGNVYVARSRIIARLREKVSEVQDGSL